MFNPNDIFQAILIIPILNVLIATYKGLQFLHTPWAFGFALIALTVFIRLLLHPLTATQLKSAKKLAQLKPELDKLSTKHKDDKTKLQQEQLRLYKEAGINPAAGCLPLLLQMPILIALYNLFFKLLTTNNTQEVIDGINKVMYIPGLRIQTLDLSFMGMSLAQKPSSWQTAGWWLLLIPVITALLQYWQTKMMVPSSSAQKTNLEKVGEKPKDEDMGSMMQKQMSVMMPLMIGFFAYSFPLGLALYWNTFTIFGIIQQYNIGKKTT